MPLSEVLRHHGFLADDAERIAHAARWFDAFHSFVNRLAQIKHQEGSTTLAAVLTENAAALIERSSILKDGAVRLDGPPVKFPRDIEDAIFEYGDAKASYMIDRYPDEHKLVQAKDALYRTIQRHLDHHAATSALLDAYQREEKRVRGVKEADARDREQTT